MQKKNQRVVSQGDCTGSEFGTYRHPGSFRGSGIAKAELLDVISYRFISENNGAHHFILPP